MNKSLTGGGAVVVLRKIGAIWGVAGTMTIVGYALYRLSFYAFDSLGYELTVWQLLVLITWGAYMFYAEGIKGFARSFSPRSVARAQYIARHGRWHHIIFAPIFCFGYYQTTRRKLIVIYSLTAGIVGLILIIRLLPQPWRGIIDFGVVLGLSCGLVTLAYFAYKAWRTRQYAIDPAVTTDKN
ncbi:MAG: hypothetical protein L0H36_02020 [bacterium]|nr:hypothetical protein [bacterium]MDN5835391.1 hypothetical protein [bacterium]